MAGLTMLRVERMAVRDAAGRALVAPFDLVVQPGCVATLVGESGAGKSLVCAAIAGTLPPDLTASGRIWIDGRDATALSAGQRRALWAAGLFLLPQEPWHALAPGRTVMPQTADTPRAAGATGSAARQTARALLTRLGLDADADGRKRPWQLSGGMAQRAAVAAALGAPAPLVLVDEPTKGLDATLRGRVRDSLVALGEAGRALVLVTHDLLLARQMGGELLVMQDGAVVERGPAAPLLARPRHAFTRALVAAVPGLSGARRDVPNGRAGPVLVQLDALGLSAGNAGRMLPGGLDLVIRRGEMVGLSGPSGSGKTTLGDTILGLRRPAAGRIVWADATPRPGARQKLYQDPAAAFAPWRPVRATLADALAAAGHPRRAWAALDPLMARLRIGPALLDRRPAAVSGGELQRLALLRAMLARPAFLFADEPTSRLDPITQHEVAALLQDIAAEGVACLVASHDPRLLADLTTSVVRIGPGSHIEPGRG